MSSSHHRNHEVINVANPGDAEDATSLFRFWFGQIGSTFVYVWGSGGDVDSAFEQAVEWLDDNDLAGHFTDVTEDDLKEAAEDEGIKWKATWPDWEDPAFERVVQAAEADLTQIGHTTMKHGQYLVSYEWGVDEVTDEEEWDRVEEASADDEED